MLKKLFAIGLLAIFLVGGDVWAQRSASGGGSRSYSSGGGRSASSSPSRPSSSSSSRPSPSASGGGGRSYSSGSSPTRPTPAPSASGGGGNRSYTTGPPATAPPRSTPAPSASGGSGRSYGSTPAAAPSAQGGGNRSYGAGSAGGGVSNVRANSNIDQSGVAARQRTESQHRYEQAQRPAETYRNPSTGASVPISPTSPAVNNIRRTVTTERYVHRETRIHDFYGPTYIGRPVVYYSDPFGPFFWFWLLDRSADERAMWYYHHRSTDPTQFDQRRLAELRAHDAEFDARLKRLEGQNIPQNGAYVPSALNDDPDLMYSDQYVEGVYNPVRPPPSAPREPTDWSGFWTFIKWCFWIALTITVVWFLVWFVFIRETED